MRSVRSGGCALAVNLVDRCTAEVRCERGLGAFLVLMAFFRFFAVVFIVLGLMLLGADVVTMLERGGEPHMRSLTDVWALFSAAGAKAFSDGLAGLPQPVADGAGFVMALPAFAMMLVLGVVLALVFRQGDDLSD